ncbi:MAG: hypothetical protein JSW40_02630 [Candidatus Omnitrophota bacterium]|nr:MAG: hypothetical protein JSW40_02630 [Candidatus Omnitrophota bacterium]
MRGVKKVNENHYKCAFKKAQSFLEYSFLLAVAAAVLIVMQHYMGRSLQGHLKQHVDNLGGEKVTAEKFSPGQWYGAGDLSSVVEIRNTGFDYEGTYVSYMHNTRTINQLSTITGVVIPETPPEGEGEGPQAK